MSNYVTKSNLKNPTSGNTLKFAKKDNLVNLKSVNGNRYWWIKKCAKQFKQFEK